MMPSISTFPLPRIKSMAFPVRIGIYNVKITLIIADIKDIPINNPYFFIY